MSEELGIGEPWAVRAHPISGLSALWTTDGTFLVTVRTWEVGKRIVDCVNACQGVASATLAPGAVGELASGIIRLRDENERLAAENAALLTLSSETAPPELVAMIKTLCETVRKFSPALAAHEAENARLRKAMRDALESAAGESIHYYPGTGDPRDFAAILEIALAGGEQDGDE